MTNYSDAAKIKGIDNSIDQLNLNISKFNSQI